jgi:hypothetical protein
MRRLTGLLRLAVTAVAIAVSVEAGYRVYLYLKHPNYFTTTAIDDAEFSILSDSIWRYDADYGWRYVPALKVDVTNLKEGRVVGCGDMAVVNEQGNSGPSVPDFEEADIKIAVLGDSFSSAEVAGPAWTKMLGERLEHELGKTVRVLNLARDGYGIPQMIALANGKLKDVRPALIIFAFHGTALDRGRAWRALVGEGDDVRLYTSTENSPTPNPANAADGSIIMPSVTRSWCEAHRRKPPDEQRSDPMLQKIMRKHHDIALQNGGLYLDPFDLRTSFVYGAVRYRSPFRALWTKLRPSTNPLLPYEDYRDDPKLLADMAAIKASGIPYMLVHFALGRSISEGREFDLDYRSRRLLGSLRDIAGVEIQRTSDFVSLSREDALKMCRAPFDCHPSEFGMEVYADAVSKMVLKSGLR